MRDPHAPWYVAAFGAHYPLLYRHRDAAEAQRCLALLPRLAPLRLQGPHGLRPVLDLGCGDGRHLRLLQEAGMPAIGLDLSASLLASAAARAPLVRGDMRSLPFRDESFAAVLSLFTAFGYFGPPPDDGGVTQEVARTLAEGGHWFLDYLDSDKVMAELAAGPVVRERRVECLLVSERRTLPAERQVVCKEVTLTAVAGEEAAAGALGIGPQGLTYREEVALYTLAQLDALAGAAGLCRVAAAGDYDGAAPGSGPRWLLVYRKENRRLT